ncbi:hypothetical protein FGRMN_6102 [Fusarium graminum]|nr:hypothetical protein FGRMN_6102 [Fusarium graminum]
MDHYVVTLAILIVILTFAAYWHHDHALSKLFLISADEVNRLDMMDDEIHDVNHETTAERFFSFCNNFLWVYGLVMTAEWLQAAYLYSALKNSHRLSEPCIAYLFATGFVCAGTGTLFVGSITNKHGRVLGGVSNALVYSAFETWMLAEHRTQGFTECDGAIGVIQSSMAVTNGLVAVGSGIVAQMIATATGSQTAPFAVSLICLGVALFIISRTWIDNSGLCVFSPEDLRVFAITFILCFFEGTISLVAYSWPQMIISVRTRAKTWGNPPFGLAFSNFMCSLTLGSFLFAYVSRERSATQVASRTLQLALSISATTLLLAIISKIKAPQNVFIVLCLTTASQES